MRSQLWKQKGMGEHGSGMHRLSGEHEITAGSQDCRGGCAGMAGRGVEQEWHAWALGTQYAHCAGHMHWALHGHWAHSLHIALGICTGHCMGIAWALGTQHSHCAAFAAKAPSQGIAPRFGPA
eukprot:1152400-Pelagomonas_calceolata.AAC.1